MRTSGERDRTSAARAAVRGASGTRRSGARIALAALTALLLSDAGQSARAADRISVGVVSIGNALQWPLYIAVEKGFMTEQGIEADVVAGQSSPNLLRQIAAGAVDIGLPTAADTFRAVAKGAPIVMLRTDTERSPQVLMARPAIKRLADLKDKIITVGAADGIDRFYLNEKLKPAGIGPHQFDAMLGGGAANRFSALMSGAVDAAGISPPELFAAEEAGYTNLGSLDLGHRLPWTCIAAYRPWLEKSRSIAVRYLTAYAKAVDWFNDPAHQAEAVAILAKAGKGGPQGLGRTYDYYRNNALFDRRGELRRDVLDEFLKILAELKYVESGAAPSLYYDDSYAAAALRTSDGQPAQP
jgi:NitT/TauT family transport system substrate-binding protein